MRKQAKKSQQSKKTKAESDKSVTETSAGDEVTSPPRKRAKLQKKPRKQSTDEPGSQSQDRTPKKLVPTFGKKKPAAVPKISEDDRKSPVEKELSVGKKASKAEGNLDTTEQVAEENGTSSRNANCNNTANKGSTSVAPFPSKPDDKTADEQQIESSTANKATSDDESHKVQPNIQEQMSGIQNGGNESKTSEIQQDSLGCNATETVTQNTATGGPQQVSEGTLKIDGCDGETGLDQQISIDVSPKEQTNQSNYVGPSGVTVSNSEDTVATKTTRDKHQKSSNADQESATKMLDSSNQGKVSSQNNIIDCTKDNNEEMEVEAGKEVEVGSINSMAIQNSDGRENYLGKGEDLMEVPGACKELIIKESDKNEINTALEEMKKLVATGHQNEEESNNIETGKDASGQQNKLAGPDLNPTESVKTGDKEKNEEGADKREETGSSKIPDPSENETTSQDKKRKEKTSDVVLNDDDAVPTTGITSTSDGRLPGFDILSAKASEMPDMQYDEGLQDDDLMDFTFSQACILEEQCLAEDAKNMSINSAAKCTKLQISNPSQTLNLLQPSIVPQMTNPWSSRPVPRQASEPSSTATLAGVTLPSFSLPLGPSCNLRPEDQKAASVVHGVINELKELNRMIMNAKKQIDTVKRQRQQQKQTKQHPAPPKQQQLRQQKLPMARPRQVYQPQQQRPGQRPQQFTPSGGSSRKGNIPPEQ